MSTSCQRRWRLFWAGFLAAFLLVTAAYAMPVNLIAYVTYSLLNASGTPLADGSIVMIFGSTDNVNNGPVNYGTNVIAESTKGDDVFIGLVRVDMPSYNSSNGTFLSDSDFAFDDSSIHFLYLRIFDTTNYGVTGFTNWTTSLVFGYTSEFGYAVVDFGGNYQTTLKTNFVVIPEPSSSHLVLLFVALVCGMRASMKKAERKTVE